MHHSTLQRIAVGFVSVAAVGTLGLTVLTGPIGSAAASSPPVLKRVSPISGPTETSIAVKIHGKGFGTVPGATTVSFGGTPAVSVNCTSPTLCTAVTPNLPIGPATVSVTTGGTTLNTQPFTVTTYAPPIVRLVLNAKDNVEFSLSQLVDKYPAQGGPGNDYVVIENTTSVPQSLTTNNLGPATIASGASEGFTMAADNGPYIYFTSHTPTKTLTVNTKTPS